MLYVIPLTLLMALILCGIYLILMKYHSHLKEVLTTQQSLMRTLTNLAVSEHLQTFLTLEQSGMQQTETSTNSLSPSNFDPNLIDEDQLVKQFQRVYNNEDFVDEFGGVQ